MTSVLNDDDIIIDESRSTQPVRSMNQSRHNRVQHSLPLRLNTSVGEQSQPFTSELLGLFLPMFSSRPEPVRQMIKVPQISYPPPTRLRSPTELKRSATALEPVDDDEVQVVRTVRSKLIPVEDTSVAEAPKTLSENSLIERENALVFEELKKALKCSVCLDSVTNLTSTKCGHIFCNECIRACIKANHQCPTCRHKLNYSDIHPLYLA